MNAGKPPGVTAIVLAGGLSKRLGRDKAVETVGGVPLLERVVDALAGIAGETLLITAPGLGERALSGRLGVRWLEDVYPGKGAMGGIYTGLRYASFLHSLVVACDMPFLSSDLLRYLAGLAPGHDVVVPLLGGHLEPLHAVYSRNCLGHIESLFEQGNLKVTDLFPQVKVRTVPETEVDRFDPRRLSFFNMNTRADLDRARLRMGRGNAEAAMALCGGHSMPSVESMSAGHS